MRHGFLAERADQVPLFLRLHDETVITFVS